MTDQKNEVLIDALADIENLSKQMIQTASLDKNGNAIIVIEVDPEQGEKLEEMRQDAERKIHKLSSVKKLQIILTAQKPAPSKTRSSINDPHGMAKNPPITVHARRIIVVASGKGGVGKSTVAANIATQLANTHHKNAPNTNAKTDQTESNHAKTGLRVGLLDADIYGPSQPLMMGDEEYKPTLSKNKKLIPLERYGVKIMSIGFMTEREKALVWRGPMVQTAFYQMLRDVEWGTQEEPLDYLIIDMPPGTGDVQLTLAQKVSVDGAIIVTTPQDIALIDARRAIEMFKKTNVRCLGIVENMSTHICENCGHEDHIFGQEGGQKEAERQNVPFLGNLPLSKNIRLNADQGKPITISAPDSAEAKAYKEIVEKIISAQA